MDLVALCMTSIMIYHVKTKYTAVGKAELCFVCDRKINNIE
jgi:hypothetical protein